MPEQLREWVEFQALVGHYLRVRAGGNAVREMSRPDNAGAPLAGGDGGRDFQTTVPPNSRLKELFGCPVLPGRTYFVEAKWKSAGPLEYAAPSVNLSRVQNIQVEKIFIVTNSYPRPSVHYDLSNNFPTLRGKLEVIDGRTLRHFCELADVPWPSDIEVIAPSAETRIGDIVATTGFQQRRTRRDPVQHFYMAFRNVGDRERSVEVFAPSDADWTFSDGDTAVSGGAADGEAGPDGEATFTRTLVLAPWRSAAVRLCGKFLHPDSARGAASEVDAGRGARIAARVGDEVVPLFKDVPPIRVAFKPPFTGKRNNALRESLRAMFEDIPKQGDKAAFRFILITGAAGVGKSRLVEEVLPYGDSSFVIIEHTVYAPRTDRAFETDHWAYVRAQLKVIDPRCDERSLPGEGDDGSALLGCLLDTIQKGAVLGRWGGVILALDDLHNATDRLCVKIREAICDDHELGTNVIVVATARDDDTYINAAYREFAGALALGSLPPGKGSDAPMFLKVEDLDAAEAGQMVADLVEGIQPGGISRILALSGPVPHHIVQCVEYLLDESLAAVTGRDTLSIVDQRTFEERSASLPVTMEDLYALRFANLADWNGDLGKAAQEALLAAAVFGTRFPEAVCGLLPGADVREIARELIDRRFFSLGEGGAGKELIWHHESLLLFFGGHRRLAAQSLTTGEETGPIAARFRQNALLLRENQQAWAALPTWPKADTAVAVDDLETAAAIFAPLMTKALSIETFNTLDMESSDCFDHFEHAVELVRRKPCPDRNELLWRLLVLKSFVGAYHLGLRHETDAFAWAVKALPRLDLPGTLERKCLAWLQAIDAQVHLDSGYTGRALERFLRLSHVARLANVDAASDGAPAVDSDLAFDIHNSMRLLYTYSNFRELALLNGELAARYAGQTASESVRRVDLGDLALSVMMTDRRRCVALLRKALAGKEGEQGTLRHLRHSTVSLIAATLSDNLRNPGWLSKRAAEMDRLVAECLDEGYHSILPRTYLLRAVIEYLLARLEQTVAAAENRFDGAMAIAAQGLNACEAYSIGFVSWQLRNLRAVIEGRRSNWTHAIRELWTAMVLIEREGLTFMGCDGLVSAVPVVIGNYVRAASERASDRRVMRFLGSLRGFETYGWGTPAHLARIKEHVRRYRHIVPGFAKQPDGLIVDDKTGLAVLAWF